MFTKHDVKFTETAVDPDRRLAAITNLTSHRTLFFWCACVVSLAAFAVSVVSGASGGALAVIAVVQWMVVFKCESDLRLLMVVDRLHR